MIWNTIQSARRERKDLLVIRLDLANAYNYGSVPHKLIEKAVDFFYVPDRLSNFIMKYYGALQMRFSTFLYTARWQPLEDGIPMGCSISPLLFVLAMETVLREAKRFAQGVEAADGQVTSPMKAFMDDITVLTGDTGGAT